MVIFTEKARGVEFVGFLVKLNIFDSYFRHEKIFTKKSPRGLILWGESDFKEEIL